MTGSGLEAAVRRMRTAEWVEGDVPVVAAVSGGVDSMTLAYLLRFEVRSLDGRLHVAHLDHRMREGSGRDTLWLAGVCRAWGIPFHSEASSPAPVTEADARDFRYEYLERVRERIGAVAVLTGHTADDQAETVLFRLARGAGPTGLAGIRRESSGGVVRPLLDVWRQQVEAFAKARRIPFREDPTNRELRWARNRIRHRVLPALERAVPGAAGSLARLASLLADESEALAELSDAVLDELAEWAEDGALLIPVGCLTGLPGPVAKQVVRRACFRAGGAIGYEATETLAAFLTTASSGSELHVGGGLVAELSMGRLRIGRARSLPEGGREEQARWVGDLPDHIVLGEGSGTAMCRLADRVVEVRWGPEATEGPGDVAVLARDHLLFPLALRARRPGDRLSTPYGKKKLKKVFLELEIPRFDRDRTPVLADGSGAVLWVPGLRSGPVPEPVNPFYVTIRLIPEEQDDHAAE